jgi:hypothetical protein
VLASLGLAEEDSPPRLEVWNKLDLLAPGDRVELLGEAKRRDDVIVVSALTGEGVDDLREAISHLLHAESQTHHIRLNAGDGPRIAWLHARGEVLEQHPDGDQLHLSVKLSPGELGTVRAALGLDRAFLASTQSASFSSRLISTKPGACSIVRKRFSNFRLAFLSASSGSMLRNRAKLTTANSRSPTSPPAFPAAPRQFRPVPRGSWPWVLRRRAKSKTSTRGTLLQLGRTFQCGKSQGNAC